MSWSRYLAEFHRHHPGITEAVLTRARRRGQTGYEWLLDAVPAHGRVLDLACGSAPLWPALRGRPYLGVDLSAAELDLARRRGAGPLLRADATALPMAEGSADTVVCAMALQVITPLPAALAEIARVLVPGGRLVVLLPDRWPLRGADLLWLAGLVTLLGRTLGYPNDGALRHRLPRLLTEAGLERTDSERQRFAYPLRTTADADLLLSSLYLPGVPASRRHAARRWLHLLVRARAVLPLPLRRVTAVRAIGSRMAERVP